WPTGADAGSSQAPIPAILSDRLPTGAPPVAVGDEVSILIRGVSLRFQLVGRTSDFPGVRSEGAFVIVPYPSLVAGWHGTPPAPSVVFARGDAATGGAIQAA